VAKAFGYVSASDRRTPCLASFARRGCQLGLPRACDTAKALCEPTDELDAMRNSSCEAFLSLANPQRQRQRRPPYRFAWLLTARRWTCAASGSKGRVSRVRSSHEPARQKLLDDAQRDFVAYRDAEIALYVEALKSAHPAAAIRRQVMTDLSSLRAATLEQNN
jgi:hypothetical protein